MNIFNPASELIVAKTCGCQTSGKRVTYAFVPEFHDLCVDKKDIIEAEIGACQKLIKYVNNEEHAVVEKEIQELKMALDFMP